MPSSVPFDRNAERWRQYGAGLKGRLRLALILEQLRAHLPADRTGRHILDVGCGTGELAEALMPDAGRMVLVDFSAAMLAEVRRRLAGGRWPAEPELVHGEVEAIDDLVPEGSFDLILCHNLIEYVADPQAVLLSLARRLVPSGLLSLVTANPTGDAIRLALLEHDLPGAQQALERRTSTAALFDGIPKRSFSPAQIDLLLQRAGIDRTDRYGVRVFADYLPERALEAPGSEDALFELEREAGRIEEYRALARYWHLIGRQTAADFIRR